MTRLIDISLPLQPDLPTWPGGQYLRERQRTDYSSVPEGEVHDTIG
jgi:kynurenine formamidase